LGPHRKNLPNEVLEFIVRFIVLKGYPPTFDEIGEAFGLRSKGHIDYILGALEEAGRIERTPNTPRGLRLPGLPRATLEIQVVGRIAAGRPLDIGDELGRQIVITTDMVDPRKELFALEVEGDSMVDGLVADGDVLIVERRQEASRGQMAVVHLRDRNSATLKRIYPEGERVRLQPAHPTMEAFYVDASDVEVQGRVAAVVRRL